MRYFTLALFLVLTNTCHAGIVYNNTSTSSSVTISSSSTTLGSRGQTFTNGSLAAQILSVTVYLKNTTGATGNISIVLRASTGTPGSTALPTGSALATSTAINANTIGTSSTAVTFSGFTGTNTTLAANTNYAFTVNMQGVTGTLDLYYGSQIANQNSYSTLSSLVADSTNDLAGTVITSTPEPGTLILFGSAMAIASAGAYLKRRKQKQANPG